MAVPIEAILEGAAAAGSFLGLGGGGDGKAAEVNRKTQLDQMLLGLILDSLDRERANQREQAQLGVRAPLAQSAIRQGRSGDAMSRTLGARMRQFQAGGGATLAPGTDNAASPEQLQPLIIRGIGDIQRMRAGAQEMTSGITAENLFVPRGDPLAEIHEQFPRLFDDLQRAENRPGREAAYTPRQNGGR